MNYKEIIKAKSKNILIEINNCLITSIFSYSHSDYLFEIEAENIIFTL